MRDEPAAFDLWLRRDLRQQYNPVLREDLPLVLLSLVEGPPRSN